MTSSSGGPDFEGPREVRQFGRAGHRVAASVLSGAGNTIFVAGLGAVATRLVTVSVGPTQYGLFVTALTFVSTAMLFTDLGVTSITGRDIAQRPNEAAEILGHNLGVRITLSILLLPLVVVLGFTLYGSSSLRWALLLFAITIPFNAAQTTTLGYYAATIRNYVTFGVTLAQQVVYVGGVAIAIHRGFGIVGCAVAYLISSALSAIGAYVLVRREVNFRPTYSLHSWSHVIRRSASLGAIQVINLLYLRADTLLLSKMAPPRAVGLYGVAYSFVNFIVVAPALILVSVMPLLATAAPEVFERILRRTTHSLAVLGALAVMMTVLFAPQAIAMLSGHRFLGAVAALRILGISCYFSYLNSALGYAAVARNRHHRMVAVSAFGLLLNVALNIVMIPRLGIDGSATATLGSELVALLGVWFVFSRDVGSRVYLIRQSIRPLAVAAVVALLARYVVLRGGSSSVASVVWAPVFLIAYLAILGLVKGLPEELAIVRARMRNLVRSRNGASSI
jgi:O-antigen/teichoic acid export membrane protein